MARYPLGPPNAGTLGAALFGPDYGPIPAIEGGYGGVEDENVYQTEQAPDYNSMVAQHIQNLQQPVQLPSPQPVPHGLAFAMALNPDQADRMMGLYREPYQKSMNEWQLTEQRKGQAAALASQMANREEARQERAWEKGHLYEQSAANAGNVNYPYQIPGMRDQARQVDSARRALTGQRNRSGVAPGPKPKFATKAHHMAWLESRLAVRQNQLTQLYTAATSPMWSKNVNGQNITADAEDDYNWLKGQREAIGKMSDSQWQRFSQLTDQEQDAVIDAMNGRGQMQDPNGGMPAPWAGQDPGQPPPLPPPYK